ncbi:probable peroxisomal acyl-coenzyme A oxidase 1 [Galleria mellonella]|uniref:Acyl-coenzyme A oxidase n=1 Tax=Galleria mellonella TaxID=7137 RepID=A0A6J1WSG6_GALME|nr:probable peroxisomal acyl-coenzyme A oxidase 1 [Galleria mellonella]
MGGREVNKDLQKERQKCTFDIAEMTTIFYGGPQKNFNRKKRDSVMLIGAEEFSKDIPDDYLSHKELYEDGIKKSVAIFSLVRQMQREGFTSISDYRDALSGLLGSAVLRDGSAIALHYLMFIPAIMNQGNEEQQTQWLPRAWDFNILGSYAQTELGHGTFIRGLETTATYDPATKEFILNTPTFSSYKWWAGGLGQTVNYCIVVAQLHTKGECHGIHSFIVQVRDEETHLPLPGVKIGEIGPKLGLNAVNNGFLGLNNVRIPRTQMLMKHAQVLEDGTYVKSRNSKLNYGAMVFVRVVIVFDMINYLIRAITIAVRYSAVRRQSQLKEGEPEVQILDYIMQRHRLFIGIAASHAYRIIGSKLWDTFHDVQEQLVGGNLDRLPELHALACCLKAVCTSDITAIVENCRRACGGHGYMRSSNLPTLYGMVTAACTYEGENNVLLLQTARFLVKTWQQIDKQELTPTVSYLKTANVFADKWVNSVDGIIHGLQVVAAGKIKSCVENMKKRLDSGMCYEDAWNTTSVQLVAAAEAHCRVIIISTFHEEVSRLLPTVSELLRPVLEQLVELYAVYWALEKLSDLLLYTAIEKKDVESLQYWYEELLREIRPNAVGLVDAFDIPDIMLNSTLGAYDGRVYERLMEEALKSPLNAEPVNSSFHKHLKPFMQGKL